MHELSFGALNNGMAEESNLTIEEELDESDDQLIDFELTSQEATATHSPPFFVPKEL